MYCKECLEKDKNLLNNQFNVANNNFSNVNTNIFCNTCGRLIADEINGCPFCGRNKVSALKKIFYFLFEGLITVLLFCSLVLFQVFFKIDIGENLFYIIVFVSCLVFNIFMNYYYVSEFEDFCVLKKLFLFVLFLFVVSNILCGLVIGAFILVALFLYIFIGFFGTLFAALISFINYILVSNLLNRNIYINR